MVMLGTSIVIFGVLLLLIRTKIGQILLLLYILLLGINLLFLAFEKEPHIQFMEDNNLLVDRAKRDFDDKGAPWYHASDGSNYYYLVPGFYRVMSKDNECRGFSRFDINTWCIESPEDFKCYPGRNGEEGCGVMLIDSN